MHGAITQLPNTPSWRGAQLKHRDNFTFLPYLLIFTEDIKESLMGQIDLLLLKFWK
jgi:hypothetical protein